MWPFKKKTKQRRLEVRKNIPAARPSLWQRIRQSGGVPTVVVGVVFFLAAAVMDAWPAYPFLYRQGQPLPSAVFARARFSVPTAQADEPQPSTAAAPTTMPAGANEDRPAATANENPQRTYYPGDLLVSRARTSGGGTTYQDQAISPAELGLLRAEHEAYVDDLSTHRPWRLWLHIAARALIVLLVVALLGFYVVKYHSQYVRQTRKTACSAALLLVMLAVAKAISLLLHWNPHAAVLPVLLGALVLTVAHDQRFALAVGAALAGLVALQLRTDLGLLLVLLAGAVTSVLLLREVRTRTKLIEISAVTGAVVVLAVVAKDTAAALGVRFMAANMLWSAGGAVLAGFLAQGGLPLIERVFRVATSITLLEWCDASKPLLKRLAMEAPGSYNHSLQLGMMCESAAEAIGARGLLARVGAYYHDIGKINKPEYFVENEAGSPSKHAKLSPAMSLLIIVGHVKDGMELADEYNLPPVLHEFIATHHGTTLVQYFYQAAAQQRKNDSDRAPDEMEFRYPGPKPHSKEAAILMLADAAESSVRAMNQPTPGHIETQVHNMVTQRLNDGQLDECMLTLKEVHQIEQSLVKSLCSIYHSRIAYPKPPEKEEPRPSLAAAQGQKEPAAEAEAKQQEELTARESGPGD